MILPEWITFGGELINSGDPIEQSKQIRFTDLVANAIYVTQCGGFDDRLEGKESTKALVAGLSLYTKDQICRFGRYDVSMDEYPPVSPFFWSTTCQENCCAEHWG